MSKLCKPTCFIHILFEILVQKSKVDINNIKRAEGRHI